MRRMLFCMRLPALLAGLTEIGQEPSAPLWRRCTGVALNARGVGLLGEFDVRPGKVRPVSACINLPNPA